MKIGMKVYNAISGAYYGVLIAINSDGTIRVADSVRTARNARTFYSLSGLAIF